MRFCDYMCCALISLTMGVLGAVAYGAFFFSPAAIAEIKTVDAAYILSLNERLAKDGVISAEIYKKRVVEAERMVSREGVVINKYVRTSEAAVPVIFGAADITPEVLAELEKIR